MTPEPHTWCEVRQLIVNFAWGIDRGNPALAAAQFVADGRLVLPNLTDPQAGPVEYRGRDAIRARWENRINITTRHAFVNVSLLQKTATEIAGTMLLLGYRHVGSGIGDTIPALISDFDDLIVRDSDGHWRFAERRVTVVFSRGLAL